MSLVVTEKLLKEWGADCDLSWFTKLYPEGVSGDMRELVKTPGIATDHMKWFTQQAAIRLNDLDGDTAYQWQVNNTDPSWIATTCIHMKRREVSEGVAKVMLSNDVYAKERLVASELAIQ